MGIISLFVDFKDNIIWYTVLIICVIYNQLNAKLDYIIELHEKEIGVSNAKPDL